MEDNIFDKLCELIAKAKSKEDLKLKDLDHSPEEKVSEFSKTHYEYNTKKYHANLNRKFVG